MECTLIWNKQWEVFGVVCKWMKDLIVFANNERVFLRDAM